ncbi:MAG: hypothetical protein ABS938_07105 [Psychrobacillus psychrodurans]
MELYHYVRYQQDSHEYINIEQVLKQGLNISTKTGSYTNGGRLFSKVTEKYRPLSVPTWIDFGQAIGAEFTVPSKPYFKFPIFTNKIRIFNREISSDLFAYIEDDYMKDETGGGYFTQGLPSKENLVKQYWESMISVEDYLANRPYENAEILIFKTVPPEILEFIE